MDNQKLLATLVVFALATTLLTGIQIVKAATESVYSDLVFAVSSVLEMTVTLRDGTSFTSAPAGNQTGDITFTLPTGTDTWINATAGGTDQDNTNPIIQIDNTGTINFMLNISINDTVPSCMDLRYNTSWTGTPEDYATDLSTTNITLDDSFTPAEAVVNLWLWGNATACVQGDSTVRRLFMYADG